MFTNFSLKRSYPDPSTHFYKLSLLSILLAGFCIISCENLAVSQDIDDADQLTPIISLTGSLNNKTRSYNSKISVLVKDKNNNAVEIEGGMVRVNGYTMTPPSTALLSSDKHDDYVFYGDIIPDELYTFEVFLSNEQVYRAWIESPEIFPTTLDVPQRIERNKDVEIKWQNTDYRYPQYLILKYYDKEEGFTNDNQIQVKIDAPFYGTYTIDKKYINYQNVSDQQENELRIILQSQTGGILDSQFSPKGTITCTYEIYTDLEIY